MHRDREQLNPLVWTFWFVFVSCEYAILWWMLQWRNQLSRHLGKSTMVYSDRSELTFTNHTNVLFSILYNSLMLMFVLRKYESVAGKINTTGTALHRYKLCFHVLRYTHINHINTLKRSGSTCITCWTYNGPAFCPQRVFLFSYGSHNKQH
jgi:hypothetical protein